MRTRTFLAGGAAVLTLALVGCSAEEPDEANATAPSKGPSIAASGVIADATGVELSGETNVAEGKNSTIKTPSAEVEVETLADVNIVPKTLLEEDAITDPSGTDTGGEIVMPAEGEVFRVVTVRTPAPNEEASAQPTEDAGSGEEPVMGFEADRQPLGNVEMPQSTTTYVVSIPQYGEAFLTVSEAGKTQKVNLADGERDSDSEAAGYYRGPVDAGDPIELPGVKATGRLGEVRKAATLAPVLTLGRVEFSGWTKGGGWAEEGKAWLILEGAVALDSSGDGELRGQAAVDVALSVGGGSVGATTVELEKSGGLRDTTQEFTKTIEVPDDVEVLVMDVSGEVAVSAAGGVELTSEKLASAGSDRREIPVGE